MNQFQLPYFRFLDFNVHQCDVFWNALLIYHCFQVFPGNIDRDSVVNNTMPAQTTASCIRLHPSLVARDACLRMDVWGCQQTQYP